MLKGGVSAFKSIYTMVSVQYTIAQSQGLKRQMSQEILIFLVAYSYDEGLLCHSIESAWHVKSQI